MSKDIVRVKLNKVKHELNLSQPELGNDVVSSKGYFISPFKKEWRDLLEKSYYSSDNGGLIMYGAMSSGMLATLGVALGSSFSMSSPDVLSLLGSFGIALLSSTGLGAAALPFLLSKIFIRNKKVIQVVKEMSRRQKIFLKDWLLSRYNLEISDENLVLLNDTILTASFDHPSYLPIRAKYAVDDKYQEFKDVNGKSYILRKIEVNNDCEFYVEEASIREAVTNLKSKTLDPAGKVSENPFTGEAAALYESVLARMNALNSARLDSEQRHILTSTSNSVDEIIKINNEFKMVNMSDESPARAAEVLASLNKQLSAVQTSVLANIEKELFIHFSVQSEKSLAVTQVRAIESLKEEA